MKDSDDRVRPFYCGTQGLDWRCWNCRNCRRYNERTPTCDIDRALLDAYFGDGSVSADIARRMGHPGFRCTELDARIPPRLYYEFRLKPLESEVAPLWQRIREAWRMTLETWNRPWEPEVDIYGVMGRIPLRLSWHIAWSIWGDLKRPKRLKGIYALSLMQQVRAR